MTDQSLNLQGIDIKGVSVDDAAFPLKWKARDAEQVMADYDIKGATFQWPGNTLCTNCAIMSDAFMGVFLKDNKGSTFDNIEFVLGDKVHPHKMSKQVFLMGDCAVRNNSDCHHAVKIRGCPVGVGDSIFKVYNNTLSKSKRRKLLALRMLKGMAEKLGIYEETFPRPYSYNMPDFDRSFYR